MDENISNGYISKDRDSSIRQNYHGGRYFNKKPLGGNCFRLKKENTSELYKNSSNTQTNILPDTNISEIKLGNTNPSDYYLDLSRRNNSGNIHLNTNQFNKSSSSQNFINNKDQIQTKTSEFKYNNPSQSNMYFNNNQNFSTVNTGESCNCESIEDKNYDHFEKYGTLNTVNDTSNIYMENSYLKFRMEELNKSQIDLMFQLKVSSQNLIEKEETLKKFKKINAQLMKNSTYQDNLIAEIKSLKTKINSQKDIINNAEQENQFLSNEIKQKESYIEELISVIKLSEAKMKSYDITIENIALTKKIENENHKFTYNTNNNFKELDQAKMEFNLKIAELEKIIATKSREINSLNMIIKEKEKNDKYDNDKNSHMNSNILKHEDSLKKSFLEEIEIMKNNYLEKTKENEELIRKIKTLELEAAQNCNKTINYHIKDDSKALNEKIKNLNNQINEMSIEITNLKSENSKLTSKIMYFSADIKKKDKYISELKTEIDHFKQSLEILDKEHEAVRLKLELIETHNTDKRQKNMSRIETHTPNSSYPEENQRKFIHINSNSHVSNMRNSKNNISYEDNKIINRSIIDNNLDDRAVLENQLSEKESLIVKLNEDLEKLSNDWQHKVSKLEKELIDEINKRKLAEYKMNQAITNQQNSGSQLNNMIGGKVFESQELNDLEINLGSQNNFSKQTYMNTYIVMREEVKSLKKLLEFIIEEVSKVIQSLRNNKFNKGEQNYESIIYDLNAILDLITSEINK